MRLITSLAFGAVSLIALTGGALAQGAPAPDVKKIGDFQVRCFNVKSVSPCDLYEERDNPNTGQRVLSLSIAYMPATSRYVMQIAVPLGVSIEKGLIFEGGSFTSPQLSFRRCDRSGCYVEVGIDKSLIDAFSKMGPQAKLKLVADDGKTYEFPMPFDGFAAANDAMVEQNKTKATGADGSATSAPAAPKKK